MNLTDDALLELLSTEFAPGSLEPPAARVAALRRTVAEHNISPTRRRVPVWQRGARRCSMFLAAGGLVVGGATAAAAATGHLPQPIRALAHEVGIGDAPQPRPTVSDQLAELRRALTRGDHTKARALAQALQRNREHLDNTEQAQLNAQVDTMMHEAGMEPAPVTDTPGSGTTDSQPNKDPRNTVPVPKPGTPPPDNATSENPPPDPASTPSSDPSAAPDTTTIPDTPPTSPPP